MKTLKNEINWPKELREYVIKRIESRKKKKIMKEVIEDLRKIGRANVPKGFSMESVREDRDSY